VLYFRPIRHMGESVMFEVTKTKLALMVALALLPGCFDVGYTEGGPVPPQVVGITWRDINSGSSYYDPATGHYTSTNSEAYSFKFFSNSTYEYALRLESALYSCVMVVTVFETGNADWTETTVTTTPTSSTFRSEDSCNSNNNYTKQGSMHAYTFKWSLQPNEYDSSKQNLVLVWPNGDVETFRNN
jgi:hypothetical protein